MDGRHHRSQIPGPAADGGGRYAFRFFDIDGRTVELSADVELQQPSREDGDVKPPRPDDADGFRTVWAECQERWAATIESARALPAAALHQRVDGEWSFIQTLRHLLFVTDAWVSRGLLGERAPYHPLGLAPTGMRAVDLADLDARPTLDEVLALRAERTARVDRVMAGLTEAELAEERRVSSPGHPRAGLVAVRRCLLAVVGEEWQHREYAERDLAKLKGRG